MNKTKTKITERLTDAADLLIDFATLGEYGMEPAPSRCRPARTECRPGRTRARSTAKPLVWVTVR